MFENRVLLMKMFGPKRDEVRGGGENELYSSTNKIWVINQE
jgi:hypothetical protein